MARWFRRGRNRIISSDRPGTAAAGIGGRARPEEPLSDRSERGSIIDCALTAGSASVVGMLVTTGNPTIGSSCGAARRHHRPPFSRWGEIASAAGKSCALRLWSLTAAPATGRSPLGALTKNLVSGRKWRVLRRLQALAESWAVLDARVAADRDSSPHHRSRRILPLGEAQDGAGSVTGLADDSTARSTRLKSGPRRSF